jgi:hypothetical protein
MRKDLSDVQKSKGNINISTIFIYATSWIYIHMVVLPNWLPVLLDVLIVVMILNTRIIEVSSSLRSLTLQAQA